METYHIDWLPGENVILGKIYPSYSVRDDTPAASQRVIEVFESATEPVPYILDVSEMKMDFGEMVGAMGLLTKGDLAAFVHPNLKQLIFISEDQLVKIGATALGQSQYGGRRAIVLPTVDAALKHLGISNFPKANAA